MVTFTVSRILPDGELIDTKNVALDPANFSRLQPSDITETMPDGTPKTIQLWDCLNKWTSVYIRQETATA
jgi:hypothetical protein